MKESFKVWEEDIATMSDHRLITCQIEIREVKEQEIVNQQEKELEEYEDDNKEVVKGWKRRDKGDRKFWNRLCEKGNEIMNEWIHNTKTETKVKSEKHYIENMLQSYEEQLNRTLDHSLGKIKKKKGKRQARKIDWDNDVFRAVCDEKNAYRKWRENKNEESLKQQWRMKKKIRKRLVRKHKRKLNQEIITNIEKLKTIDPKEYWKQLK